MRLFASDFFHELSSPKPPKIKLGSLRIFPKICGDIRKCRSSSGINDTRGKFSTGVNDTGGKKNGSGSRIQIHCNLLIPRPPLRTPKLQEKPSALKRELPVLKNMNILDIFSIFVSNFCPPGSSNSN